MVKLNSLKLNKFKTSKKRLSKVYPLPHNIHKSRKGASSDQRLRQLLLIQKSRIRTQVWGQLVITSSFVFLYIFQNGQANHVSYQFLRGGIKIWVAAIRVAVPQTVPRNIMTSNTLGKISDVPDSFTTYSVLVAAMQRREIKQ